MRTVKMAAQLAAVLGGVMVSGAALAQASWNWGTGTGTCDPATCTWTSGSKSIV